MTFRMPCAYGGALPPCYCVCKPYVLGLPGWCCVLQECHGVLRTKQDAYQAVHQLIASLHDQYSDFLPPSQFRRALRRPSPAERNYLEAQFVGKLPDLKLNTGNMAPRPCLWARV